MDSTSIEPEASDAKHEEKHEEKHDAKHPAKAKGKAKGKGKAKAKGKKAKAQGAQGKAQGAQGKNKLESRMVELEEGEGEGEGEGEVYGREREREGDDAVEAISGSVDADRTFAQFAKRVKIEPEQVVRYGGNVLWPVDANPVVPACPCGAQRRYETQVLPQLLNRLPDDLDWATLALYTCERDCTSASYVREHCFRLHY